MATNWKRRIGLALGAVLVLVVAGLGTLLVLSGRNLRRRYTVPEERLVVARDSATLERGRHLATTITKCTECHGEDLGGQQMEMGPVGSFSAANLTSGKGGFGGLAKSDLDWVRAVRHGVAPDGRSLVFMPSQMFARLTAEDLSAIIAYVKSVPPVDRELGPLKLGPIGRLLVVTQTGRWIPAAGINHSAPFPEPVAASDGVAYGRYLTEVGGCTYCHGDNLKGGLKEGPPGTPLSADLTQAGRLGRWTETDFRNALRTGLRPDGSTIDPFMPWRAAGGMTDAEIRAVWEYLRTL